RRLQARTTKRKARDSRPGSYRNRVRAERWRRSRVVHRCKPRPRTTGPHCARRPLMPFHWFVALRYLRDSKGETALILSAVSVGVSVVVFLSALINGLQASLIESTLGSQPHVTLSVPR